MVRWSFLALGLFLMGQGLAAPAKPTPSPTPSQKAKGAASLLPANDPLKPEDDKEVQPDQKAIEKSRWVQPSPGVRPDLATTKTEHKVSIEANCTDGRGMTHGVSDPGYGACVHEMSRAQERDKESLDPNKSPGIKPSVGAGVNLKIGK